MVTMNDTAEHLANEAIQAQVRGHQDQLKDLVQAAATLSQAYAGLLATLTSQDQQAWCAEHMADTTNSQKQFLDDLEPAPRAVLEGVLGGLGFTPIA